MADPNVYFASERTMLAWIRTGLTVIALGFVVTRFNLFLTFMTAANPAIDHPLRNSLLVDILGLALVFLGTASILGSLVNHYIYVRSLPKENIPQFVFPWLTTFLACSLSLAGIVLIVLLFVS